jgi:hypothetical protein
MVNIGAKWAMCMHIIQQSLSLKLFGVHKVMEIELQGKIWCR